MPETKTVNYNDLFGDAKDVAVDPSLLSSSKLPQAKAPSETKKEDVIEKGKKFLEEEATKDELKGSKYLSFMHEHLGDAAHYAEQFASGLTLGYAPVEAKKDEGLISDILSEGAYLTGMGVNLAALPWGRVVKLGGSLLEATGVVPKVVSTLARSSKIIGRGLESGGIGALYGSFEKKSKEESRLQHVVNTGTAFALFSAAGGTVEEVASKLSPTIKNVLLKVGKGEALTKADKRILKAFHIGEGMAVGAGAGFVRPAKDIKERFRNAGVGAGSFGLVHAISPMGKSAKAKKTEEDVVTPEQVEKDVSPGLKLLKPKDISERRNEGLEAKEQREKIKQKIKLTVRENIKKNTPLLARKNEELIKAVVKEAEQKEAPKAEQSEIKTEAQDKQGTAVPQEETPVNTGEEGVAPTEEAVNRAQESERGTPLQEDVVQPKIEEIRTKAGVPFKNKGALVMSLKKKGLYETHEPVQVGDGWVGKPKPTEQEQTEVLKAFAEERGIPFVEGEDIAKESQKNKGKAQPIEQPKAEIEKPEPKRVEAKQPDPNIDGYGIVEVLGGREKGVINPKKGGLSQHIDWFIKKGIDEITVRPNGWKTRGKIIGALKGKGWVPWETDNTVWMSPERARSVQGAKQSSKVKKEEYKGEEWADKALAKQGQSKTNKTGVSKTKKEETFGQKKQSPELISKGHHARVSKDVDKWLDKNLAPGVPKYDEGYGSGTIGYYHNKVVYKLKDGRMGYIDYDDDISAKTVAYFVPVDKTKIDLPKETKKITYYGSPLKQNYEYEKLREKELKDLEALKKERSLFFAKKAGKDSKKNESTTKEQQEAKKEPKLLPEDIENIKHKFKGQEIEETKGGKVRIKLKNGATITVTSLGKDADNNTILTAKGEVLGKTKGTEIKLNLSKADGTTLTHEIKHALDNLGVISKHENRLIETEFLRRKQKGTLPFEPSRNPDKSIAREENIAEMFSHMLKEREKYRKGAIGKVVQRAGDVVDTLKHMGKASLRKLALETETGKIFEREPVGEITDKTRYKVDEKVPPEKVEKDFLETRDSLARSFVNMIKGNVKFRKDVFKNDKEDLRVVENILGSTMFNARRVGGAYERLYDNVLVKIPDFKLERQKYLRGEGDASWLKPLTDLKKRNRILYRRLNNYIVGKDINAEGYKVVKKGNGFVIKDPKGKIVGQDTDFDAAYLKAFKAEAEATGFSDLEKDALIAYRKMSLRLYHHYADGIKEIIATCKEAGIPTPKVVTIEKGKEVKIDLQTAMKRMGERIGYYFPRERQRGAYRVDATKDGEPTQTKFFKTKVAARTYKEEMVRKGYSVEESNIGLFSEDLYQDLAPLLAQEQIINKALEKLPEGTDVKTEIAKAIANQYSALLKSHGSRARMIRRSDAVGDEVKRGYETDLVKAMASATEAAAGGWAKQKAAIDGIKIITGRDIPFEEYQKEHPDATKEDYYKFCEERKIDASRQDIIYKEATAALKDVLRNNELADNVIGAVKSVAVVKYIGLKVVSSAVNLTTLLTSVPATLKGELEIPWRDTFDALGKAVGEYAKFRAYRLGDKITGKGKKTSLSPLFDRIEEKGFDVPQYNREAVDALEGRLGTAWRHFVEATMYLFGATERINRATTIAATYMAIARRAGKPLFENGKVNDKWLEDARKISNQAHGSYGKDDRLHMARGTSPTARVLQLYTVFMKFSHTYLQEFVRLGAVKKQYGAALYMALSPMIFGGIGATIPMAIAKVYHRIFNTPEDPEETFLRAMGNSDFLRYGIPAVAGISLKGSLAMDFTPPKEIIDIFGAPGSLVRDEYEGVKNLTKGYYEQAAEKMLPSGLSKPLKAHRERTQGITTASGRPVFFGNKKLKLSKHDAWLMMFSFNPMGIDKKRTILYNEYEKKKWFRSKKADIYRDIRLFYSVPEEERSDAVAIKIKAEIANFNALIKKYAAEDFVTPIGSLKRLFREINLPPKRERTREVEE